MGFPNQPSDQGEPGFHEQPTIGGQQPGGFGQQPGGDTST